ncbi:cysteine--tRNA ligase [Candidatus Microgenomates bacterium]|nr:cysteine--tRNA ligase [Candidatus Microgenomates bacterium]
MIKFFNSLTKKKEEFRPITLGKVLMYQCGPTVYWIQHIGNLRAMVMADLITRVLRYNGLEVTFVRNYTDVGHLVSDSDEGEDKMEEGAKREGKSPQEIASKYIGIFEEDCKRLNIIEPTAKPRATEYIKPMQEMVQTLLDKDYAYQTNLAIYFDITKAKDYTRLSGQKLEENKKGAGHADVSDSEKKNPADFALWFFKKGAHANALQTWESPWGAGFPGWHLECSVMSKALLGATFDIHMGGIEHIPVHHTNEIAQSEGANGVEIAHYWLHNEHLLVDGKKMAKSEGTSHTLAEIQEHGFDPLALRYFFLQAHYRSKQNFTWEALTGAKNALKKLTALVASFEEAKVGCAEFEEKFLEAINDDCNTPQALAILWEVVKSDYPDSAKATTILKFDEVLGLGLKEVVGKKEDIPQEILKLAEERQRAKEQKNFALADEIRDKIEAMGYVINDLEDNSYQIVGSR